MTGLQSHDFLSRLDTRLSRQPPAPFDGRIRGGIGGDHALNPDLPLSSNGRGLKPAAVLVPVVMRPAGLTMLFTRRTSQLRRHAGQISFPGGRMDPGDPTLRETALREAQEEIGLDPSLVSIIGYGDPYTSGSGYHVTPVVGLVDDACSLALNPMEVEEAFEIPAGILMSDGHWEVHAREAAGRVRQYYAVTHSGYCIWGLTAGILWNLYERLYGT